MPAVALGAVCILTAVLLNEWTVARLLNLHGPLEPPTLRTAVWVFQIVAAGVGFALIRYRMPLRRVYLLAAPIPALAVLAGAESATRIALKESRSPMRALSPELGWKTSENVRLRYVHPAFGSVAFSTGRDGFRRLGDLATSNAKIFVIGDSYTEASQVSDGEAYYDQLAKRLRGVEIFAHGTGGYGSLQEYMILDHHFDIVRPDIVLWQFSANDLINNDHYLEARSPLSSRMTRPYYEDGRIEYRFAGTGFLARYSRLVRFVDARIAMLRGHGFQAVSLDRERAGDPHALERSIRTTSAIMRLVKQRTGDVPVVGFLSEGDHFADSLFSALAIANGWDYITGVVDSIAKAKATGLTVDGLPRDGHWNRTGHGIAGNVIFRELERRGVPVVRDGGRKPGHPKHSSGRL